MCMPHFWREKLNKLRGAYSSKYSNQKTMEQVSIAHQVYNAVIDPFFFLESKFGMSAY